MKGLKTRHKCTSWLSKEDVDYSKEPEEFVFIYGPQLWTVPFLEAFQAPQRCWQSSWFCLSPGESSNDRIMAVMVKVGGERHMKKDSIRESIRAHVAKGYALPKIAERL